LHRSDYPYLNGERFNADEVKIGYEQHEVWHLNKKYRCIAGPYPQGEGTTEEPSNVAQDWLLITEIEGADGKGITSIVSYYLAHPLNTYVTTAVDGWTTTIQTINATYKYLWTYEVINYTTGDPTITTPHVIGTFSVDGKDGTGVEMKGSVETYDELIALIDNVDGDARIVDETGHLWVYATGNWSDAGAFKGDAGITPHIDGGTGNWFIGNNDTGVNAKGDKGEQGVGVNMKPSVATFTALGDLEGNTIGDARVVDYHFNTDTGEDEYGHLYIYNGLGWDNTGAFTGQDGQDGTNFLPMGEWDEGTEYQITSLGTPMVKIYTNPERTTYEVYTLNLFNWVSVGINQKPSNLPTNSEGEDVWNRRESIDFLNMEKAYIGKLQAELIDANQIVTDGLTAEKIESLDIKTSNIEVLNGAKIGGFEIEGDWLKAHYETNPFLPQTEEWYSWEAKVNGGGGFVSIVTPNVKIRFGKDLIPATAGGVFTKTFEIENTSPTTGYAENEENIALSLKASNKVNNTALDVEGDLLLRGNLVQMNSAYYGEGGALGSNTIYDNIGRFNVFVLYPTLSGGHAVYLPTEAQIRAKMRNHYMDNITLEIKIIINATSTGLIALRGQYSAMLMNNNGLVHNSGNYQYGQSDMRQGDTITVQYFRSKYYILSEMK